MIESQLIRVGDSYYVLIPMTLVTAFNLTEKQPILINIENDTIIIKVGKNDAVR